MGSIFRPMFTKPLPPAPEIVEKNGERFARFRVWGRMRTVRVTIGEDDTLRLLAESAFYTASAVNGSGPLTTVVVSGPSQVQLPKGLPKSSCGGRI